MMREAEPVNSRGRANCGSRGRRCRQERYYRRNVIPSRMPALGEMQEDMAEIAQRVLERLRGNAEVRFSEDALCALQGYSFPGNVRELENVIERALALCVEGVIDEQDLLLVPVEHNHADNLSLGSKYPLPEYLDRIEKQALLEALEQTGFNRTAAAKLLGLTLRTMRYRMVRLGIKGKNGADDAD